jgi:hypothetical protein
MRLSIVSHLRIEHPSYSFRQPQRCAHWPLLLRTCLPLSSPVSQLHCLSCQPWFSWSSGLLSRQSEYCLPWPRISTILPPHQRLSRACSTRDSISTTRPTTRSSPKRTAVSISPERDIVPKPPILSCRPKGAAHNHTHPTHLHARLPNL